MLESFDGERFFYDFNISFEKTLIKEKKIFALSVLKF